MDVGALLYLGLALACLIVLWAERFRLLDWLEAQYDHIASRWSHQRTVPQATAASAPPQAAAIGEQNRMLLRDGRRFLLVGAPGQGKSTAARNLVRNFLQAHATVVVLDPDGAAWPRGVRMVGAADDWAAIDAELLRLAAMARERRIAYQQGTRDFDPLLVLIDEAPMVLHSCHHAVQIVSDLARRGRKLAISIILIAQDSQRKTLKLDGQTKLLEAFECFECRLSATGVALWQDDAVRLVIGFDTHATDLTLPHPSPASPTTTADAERLLQAALETPLPATNAKPVAADCNAELQGQPVLQEGAPSRAESLPPDVAMLLDDIDWRTVARMVQAGVIGETAALKAFGIIASGTSLKYKAAKQRLEHARAALGPSPVQPVG